MSLSFKSVVIILVINKVFYLFNQTDVNLLEDLFVLGFVYFFACHPLPSLQLLTVDLNSKVTLKNKSFLFLSYWIHLWRFFCLALLQQIGNYKKNGLITNLKPPKI